MDLFHIIDDAQAIVKLKSGIYRQAKVYRRGEDIYIGYAGGFIKLIGRMGMNATGGGTSAPGVLWLDIDGKGIELRPAGTHHAGAPFWNEQQKQEKANAKGK